MIFRFITLVILALTIGFGFGLPNAAAQDRGPIGDATAAPKKLPRAILAHAEFDGEHPVKLTYKNLTLTVTSEPDEDPEFRVPVVTGWFHGHEVFRIKIDPGRDEPRTYVYVMNLDSRASFPQVVLTYYWGGAHCCMTTKIATIDGKKKWHVVDGDVLDGEGYRFLDLDRNGEVELVSVDNSFLYAYGCYACSFAPTNIKKLAGLRLKDVTHEPKYRPFLRQELMEMEQDKDYDHASSGFLSGWVAQKALVGELDNAWRVMLRTWDRDAEWSTAWQVTQDTPLDNADWWSAWQMTSRITGLNPERLPARCTIAVSIDKCPRDKLRPLSFPEVLAPHLLEAGYISADELRRLPMQVAAVPADTSKGGAKP